MSKDAAIQLAPQVWRIPTAPKDFVNSFAIVDDDGSVTLVDCGVEKAPPKIVAGLAAIGKHPKDVTRIVLTHVHPDHAGGAAELSRQTGAPVLIHQDDTDAAAAGEVLAKPDPAYLLGRVFGRLNPGRFPAFEPGAPLKDGDVLPVGTGLRVVHTPGHSPGHVSLVHEDLLITGDALFNISILRKGPSYSPKFLCSDFAMTKETAQVLGELEYAVAAFTHGPEMREGARSRIRDFLRAG